MRIARIIGLVAAGVVLVLCLLVLAGAQFFGVPLISPIGSMVLSVYGPRLVVVPVALGLFALPSHGPAACR